MTPAHAPRPSEAPLFPRRLGWALFALQLALLIAWAVKVDRRAPRLVGSADVAPDGTRFGRSDTRRRQDFATLLRGEELNRESAERLSETATWNRNHDSFFHQDEWGRIRWWSHQIGVPEWVGWLELDEGLRGHWDPPPGTTVFADEAPLKRTTRPLGERSVLIEGAVIESLPRTAAPWCSFDDLKSVPQ